MPALGAAEAHRSALAGNPRFLTQLFGIEIDMRFQRGKYHQSKRESARQIELASTLEVDKFEYIASDFFPRILDLDRNDCLITDESSLWDFHGEESNGPFYSKILEAYGIDVSDVDRGNLAKIFQRIAEARQSKE
jgi:hypothetical protein